MSQTFKIDVREVKEFERKLRKLHKSAYPNAVRNTLDSAAFDVKQNTMPKVAKHKFIERDPRFFKANSRVEQAKGWDVSRMESVVGFFENKLSNKSNNYAVKNLEQQEHGGKIRKKTFIPLKGARVGSRGVVRRSLTIDKVADKSIKVKDINSRTSRKGRSVSVKSKREQFVVAVHKAGKGGFVMTDRAILLVRSISRSGGKWKFSLTPIYSKKTGRSINVRATKFMEHSAKLTAKKIPLFFKKHSEYQFKKYL